ncbi:MAG: GGDEF domain-containing protein [Lachnospiraceae bacterium]|nr:GGDEF domain-containing protein [Lachnospiraceae bacterium]
MARLNIALLVGDIRDIYSNSLTKGALRAAKENDCNLLLVPGRYFHVRKEILYGQYEYMFQSLFTYFSDNNIDLIVVCAGAIGMVSNTGGRNSFEEFYKNVGGIPVVTISGEADYVPNICYDNVVGFREGIDYLIQNQKCRRIAMVAGPVSSHDSNERLEAYKDALEAGGIPFEERLVIHGDFTERCTPAVVNLFRQNKNIDAVVFANDRMAIGGYDAMRQLGLRVGIDVAFMGFDNMEKDVNLNPPLASVSADASLLGYEAIITALEYRETGIVKNRTIGTQFVLRDSAMRETDGIVNYQNEFNVSAKTDFDTFAKQSFNYIYVSKTSTANRENLYRKYLFLVLELEKMYRSEKPEDIDMRRTADCFNELFEADIDNEIDIGHIMTILENVKEAALEETTSKEKKNLINFASAYAYRRLAAILCLRESNRNYVLKRMQHDVYRISADMVGFKDSIESEYAAILTNFHRIGINHSYLFLFEEPRICNFDDRFVPDEYLYLKAIQNGSELIVPETSKQRVSLKDMFRDSFAGMKGQGHLVMLNLHVRDTLYGVLLSELPYEYFDLYESLIYQVSAAIRILGLLKVNEETRQKLKESLDDVQKSNGRLDILSKTVELTGVLIRRGFLNEAMKILDGKPETHFVVGYADIDRMKEINDTYGHESGDDAITATARIIRKVMGKRGIMGRLGGDEFALMFVSEDKNDERKFRAGVQKEIKKYNEETRNRFVLSVSLGLNSYDLSEKHDINELLENADASMYRIKKRHHMQRE